MKPAFSVIFLTTLIGAAQGLLLAMYTAQFYALFNLLPVQDSQGFYGLGALLVLVLSGLGLIASFFHLGRPERAWRTAAQWRTSWLSREVIVLPAFMGTVFLYGVAHFMDWRPVLFTLPFGLSIDLTLVLGASAAVLALLLFICTGMIYGCLPFLREWHSPLTVLNYTLLGSASGFLLAAAFAARNAPALTRFYAIAALVLTLLGLASRIASLYRNSRLRPKSTLQTAIGIKHPRIVQTSVGFLGGSFNTREFFHGRTAEVVRLVKWFFLLGAFALPLLMLMLAIGLQDPTPLWLSSVFVIQYLGLLAERWFFFAQANHPQNLYYQAIN
ncbi:MAG: dimethyl sulfoxide reductase anchor subunit [Hylemonella sp.]|nr:dimethyl sulfoxide reductase anchor subunit [Hylemonella sp.]